MNAWSRALTKATIGALITPGHLAWLTNADPGSRLVRHDETGETGHVYPDVRDTPIGWTLLATRTEEGA